MRGLLKWIAAFEGIGGRGPIFLRVLAIMALVLPAPLSAAIYYVDNTNGSASDSNPGTSPSLPWRTIGKCVAKPLAAGDTCEALHGVYNARITVNITGSKGSPIVFDGSSKATIVRGFTVSGNYITIQGFNISNCQDLNHTPGTSCTTPMSSDGDYSIEMSNGIANLTVSGNHFYDTANECMENSVVNNTITFLHVTGNAFDYCHQFSEIIPNLGSGLVPNIFTVSSSNDQLSVSVQGGATQKITLAHATYNGNWGQFAADITRKLTGAEADCGDSGNCSIRSLTGGPISSISLLYVANNVYGSVGWTGTGSQCGANASGSFPCAGVFEGHGDPVEGVGSNALIENNTASHFNEFIAVGARTTSVAGGLIKLVVRNNTMGPLGHFSWDHHDGVISGGYDVGVLIEGNSAVNCYSPDNRIPMGLFEESTDSQLIGRFNYTYLCNGTSGYTPGHLVRFYNNDLGVNGSGYQNRYGTQMSFGMGAPSDSKAANNIWYNACCGNLNGDPYTSAYSNIISVRNDLYYKTARPCSVGSCSGVSGISGPTDPLLTSVSTGNYALTSSSPARNAGAALTTANGSGSSSTSITLTDPYWFQDGWAGTKPDCIAIGTITNFGCFVAGSMNYSTGAATLDRALTWSGGANVWLYSKSDGVVVLTDTTGPDIGAFPFRVSNHF